MGHVSLAFLLLLGGCDAFPVAPPVEQVYAKPRYVTPPPPKPTAPPVARGSITKKIDSLDADVKALRDKVEPPK